jgi:hypothetical protein
MPNLLQTPWNTIVTLIPFADHYTNVNADFWQPLFQDAGLELQHQAIFAGANIAHLTRWRLLNFAYPNPQQKCLEVLLWGYPKGMRNNQHQTFIQNLNDIAAFANVNIPWPNYFQQLHNLGNLNISTISKLAYFFQLNFQGFRSLILDQKLINVTHNGNYHPLHIPAINYENAPDRYVDYLRQMQMVAGMIHALPDQLELLLFSWGDIF